MGEKFDEEKGKKQIKKKRKMKSFVTKLKFAFASLEQGGEEEEGRRRRRSFSQKFVARPT